MALFIPLALTGLSTYVANDFFDWVGRDDGTLPPTTGQTPVGNNVATLAVASAVLIGSYVVYKKVIK